MKHANKIGFLVAGIMIASAAAAGVGIFSGDGPGPFEYETIRGEVVTSHGYGLYKHMSADVAVQGIGQDYVTLFLAVPLLGLAYIIARSGSLRGRFLLAGVDAYFLVTYLFYLVMAMYNEFFLVYAFLLGASFFALALTLLDFDIEQLPGAFGPKTPVKLCGGFLIFNTLAIGLLWLGVVLLIRRLPMGLLLGPVYLVFLSLLMAALIAKIIAIRLSI